VKTFLQEVAESYAASGKAWSEGIFVFPNRRAIVHFCRTIAGVVSAPVLAPKMFTIDEFISSFSPLRIPDRLELVMRLHRVFAKVTKSREPLEQFYFWGEMLLRDFDEADKNRVNAEALYKNLSDLKEIDAGFDYLSDEQKKILETFWGNMKGLESVHAQKFLRVWEKLYLVYKEYREELFKEGLAYEGMLWRMAAEDFNFASKDVRFVGFNALTPAEEKVIDHCVSQGCTMHWDGDEYYVENTDQEAGLFLRRHRLGKWKNTFSPFPSHFKKLTTIHLHSSAQAIGQAKCLGEILYREFKNGMKEEETLIVLPDESLLLPVLSSVGGAEKINVTMGFPLTQTPAYVLIEALFKMQRNVSKKKFYFADAAEALSHPYIAAAENQASRLRQNILNGKNVRIEASFFETSALRTVFQSEEFSKSTEWINYFQSVLNLLMPALSNMDKEFVLHFILLFNRMEHLFSLSSAEEEGNQLKPLQKLFRALAKPLRIPFSGMPLEGVQVMGMLETRCLDYKNVFILSLNEGVFPPAANLSSYIPYTLRKAYQLPVNEYYDGIYGYLFYRLLQRASQVHLFYTTAKDALGQGEQSRFLQQLRYETNIDIKHEVWQHEIHLTSPVPIVIQKSDDLLQKIYQRFEEKGISPTALVSYLECKLKFYFKYAVGIEEMRAPDDEISPANLGIFLHAVMEEFYKPKIGKELTEKDFAHASEEIESLMQRLLKEKFSLAHDQLEGEQLIVWEVVKKFSNAVISADKKTAPFTVKALEFRLEENAFPVMIDRIGKPLKADGSIDRVDIKGDGVRLADYKTGKVQNNFKETELLFDAGKNDWSKAVFQVMTYALLYKKAFPETQKILPALLGGEPLFSGTEAGITKGNKRIDDVTDDLPEFEERFVSLIKEIFDPQVPVAQTDDKKQCLFCDYKTICSREHVN